MVIGVFSTSLDIKNTAEVHETRYEHEAAVCM